MRIIHAITIGLALGLASCATKISEDTCLAGAWADYGYKDGMKGRSSERIAKYAEHCAKYGISPDRNAYFTAYDQGVVKYCTYERGYARGENGSSYNQVCSGALAADFAPGYDAGRAFYKIKKEHQSLYDTYCDVDEALIEVRRRLDEDNMEDGERRRLVKKERRLENRLVDIRIEARAMERQYDLYPHDFS